MTDLNEIADELRNFYLRAHRAIDRAMKMEGVSLARAKLLKFIANEGAARSADIGTTFGFSPRTVTEAIDALERDGLVQRTPDPSDRRAKRLSITPAGEAALAASEPVRQKFLTEVFGILSDEERQALSRALHKMNDRLEQIDVD
ncbi:MarR family winged helix-turn-helix transcriptional regulator [Sphingomonas sp. ASY06-1R]|uniref:MarR family winged helix-turn-helix transcriptional regulator n=1 Tax=Sphingomonas sp. ASY06-1R TaxID=3445771 RepID=UPI003FA2106A